MKHVGVIIKEKRLTLGLTQVELARKAQISNSFLCDIEKCRSNPSLSKLKSIADVLKIKDFSIFLK